MADAFRTIIVPVAGRASSRNIASAFARVGPEMLPTFLSANGQNPATHAISSGFIPTEFTDALPMATWAYDGSNWTKTVVSAGNAADIRRVAQAAGYSFTLTQINNLLATLDVSDQEPFAAMNRLGLKIINPAGV